MIWKKIEHEIRQFVDHKSAYYLDQQSNVRVLFHYKTVNPDLRIPIIRIKRP